MTPAVFQLSRLHQPKSLHLFEPAYLSLWQLLLAVYLCCWSFTDFFYYGYE